MLNLIRDVLAFSTIRTEKQNFVKLDLNGVLASVENDFELLIEERSAIIEHTDLPVIDAIPIQMSQLFGNLISNALKFIKKDRQPMIGITWETLTAPEVNAYDLESSRNYIRLSFADNGIGFNQENAEQIFNIFQRLHGRSDYEGTGIGLAICKKIAENHGGKIEAISAGGGGATFRIILPARQPA
jgi:signal transduction histidine kinase